MKKKDLIQGKEFVFNNERFCFENGIDSLVQAEVSFNKRLNKFIIWFNGAIVSSTKTFKALENKLNELKNDFNLELSKW